MNLMRIRYFLTLAGSLNFTKTAEYYYVSQSTISKQIALLEEELGVKLFSRNTQQVLLTPAGELLQEEFDEIMPLIDQALEKVRQGSEAFMGRLQIGIPPLIDINRLLPHFVRNFTLAYPGIQLEVDSFSFRELRNRLLCGQLDMIITPSFELRNETSVLRLPLSRSKSKVYYAKSLFPGKTPTLDDVADQPIITLNEEESHESSNFIQHLLNIYHLRPPRIIHMNSMEAMQLYLESGMGVAIFGSSYRVAFSDSLTYIELDDEEFNVGSDALWRMDSHNTSLPTLIQELRSATGVKTKK